MKALFFVSCSTWWGMPVWRPTRVPKRHPWAGGTRCASLSEGVSGCFLRGRQVRGIRVRGVTERFCAAARWGLEGQCQGSLPLLSEAPYSVPKGAVCFACFAALHCCDSGCSWPKSLLAFLSYLGCSTVTRLCGLRPLAREEAACFDRSGTEMGTCT